MLKPAPTPGDTSWFVHDRFGLFIHWGLYALPARHEWVKHKEKISHDDYDKYFRHFDPDLYDPDAWASAAGNAGMKYFVITTKHHEGFCLWDTQQTDYKATNTPAKRDLLRPMVEAFRRQNMRIGFYHSLIDWHHPQYVLDTVYGPYRDHPQREQMNQGRDQMKYADYLHAQTRELLTQFGQIDILWYDFTYPADGQGKTRKDWRAEELYALIRQLQPKIVLNDRLGMWNHDDPQPDVKTPEQFQPREWVKVSGKPVVWEACQTFSGSWGYHRDESSWKSLKQLITMLIDTVSKGGNLLLNVGPTGRGEFDQRALDRLNGIGLWMKRHSRSIYGCTQAPDEFKPPVDCRYTFNPQTNRLYVHVLNWPFVELHLDGLDGRVEYAQLLNDASEVLMNDRPEWQGHGDKKAGTLTIRLPVEKPDVTVPVIELFLK